ncbi:hypothetical protein TNCV_2363921 [Trichonephila clavipes]|nr:hypothetical protein TNCV_2363921 [Trichonephila clavipes]
MESEKENVRHCLFYEFDKKSTSATARRNVYQVYGEDAIERRKRVPPDGCVNSGKETEVSKISLGVDGHHMLEKMTLTKFIRSNSNSTV